MTALVEPTIPAVGRISTVGRLDLRQAFVRLGVGLAALWFVFWTCAYVIDPYTSLMPAPKTFLLLVTSWGVLVPCLTTAVAVAFWVATVPRSIRTRPSARG